MVLLDVFRVYEYIYEEEVGRLSHEGEGAPRGVGRAPTRVVASGLFWPISGTPWASSGPKMISVKF